MTAPQKSAPDYAAATREKPGAQLKKQTITQSAVSKLRDTVAQTYAGTRTPSAILPTIRSNRYNVICEPNPEGDGHVGDSPSPSGRAKLHQNLCRAEDSCPLAVRTGLLFSQ